MCTHAQIFCKACNGSYCTLYFGYSTLYRKISVYNEHCLHCSTAATASQTSTQHPSHMIEILPSVYQVGPRCWPMQECLAHARRLMGRHRTGRHRPCQYQGRGRHRRQCIPRSCSPATAALCRASMAAQVTYMHMPFLRSTVTAISHIIFILASRIFRIDQLATSGFLAMRTALSITVAQE